jgi:hypothetical protein
MRAGQEDYFATSKVPEKLSPPIQANGNVTFGYTLPKLSLKKCNVDFTNVSQKIIVGPTEKV